ncbi:methionine adenosyltransferase [Candidatus Koribacter versatilis Ellin345]|uniref:Methionine adenosyltransferase n=1 Tax=Koribacter versatilis (strain Ellin345) TaxID=204669 RepID=Q1IHT4_KORVE|nr:methionine adenosyltransferase [Candidatus Koribacter versatilis]ABF43566.1 methionine adenosyltransferase [Candidatus Koribacter versatilis Ellin345]
MSTHAVPARATNPSVEAPVTFTFTSESVSEGHPDKVCDYIADSILDAHIAQDPKARVACEVLCKGDNVVLAGEITSEAKGIDHEAIAREAIREIGYTRACDDFNADGVTVHQFLSKQSAHIALGVDTSTNTEHEQGAGDQGIMFGYATAETPTLMPLPIALAHRLTRGLAEDRKAGKVHWLCPDAKSQVSVLYEGNTPVAVTDVLISTQHSAAIEQEQIAEYVKTQLAPRVLADWAHDGIRYFVNPTGCFENGGPAADAGVTGRKIIVDTYGGFARHGGGAFSGKDPSKVDRSAAYFCRYVAREVVKTELAKRAEIQVAYAIGVAKPVSVKVETFGTGDPAAAVEFVKTFDFRPAAIIERLNLLRPIYRQTTNYGHFGKPELPWEQ